MIEVQTFALEDTDRWVQVVVDPASPAVFSFEKRAELGHSAPTGSWRNERVSVR